MPPTKPPTPEVANAGPGYLYVRGATYEGVIASTGAWTPSPMDIAELEVVLAPAIEASPLGQGRAASTFLRQYTGGATGVIEVDLACEMPAGWPADGLPSVKGGGTCYGRASYDVARRVVTRLTPNASR